MLQHWRYCFGCCLVLPPSRCLFFFLLSLSFSAHLRISFGIPCHNMYITTFFFRYYLSLYFCLTKWMCVCLFKCMWERKREESGWACPIVRTLIVLIILFINSSRNYWRFTCNSIHLFYVRCFLFVVFHFCFVVSVFDFFFFVWFLDRLQY